MSDRIGLSVSFLSFEAVVSLLGRDIEFAAQQLTQTLRVAESALIDLRAVLAKLTVILEKINATLK